MVYEDKNRYRPPRRPTSLSTPDKFQHALDLYLKSLSAERETGNPSLNETSIDLLSVATKYELESFQLIDAQTNEELVELKWPYSVDPHTDLGSKPSAETLITTVNSPVSALSTNMRLYHPDSHSFLRVR